MSFSRGEIQPLEPETEAAVEAAGSRSGGRISPQDCPRAAARWSAEDLAGECV